MMRRLHITVLLLVTGAASLASMCSAADRPNIVWILSEDNSKHYLKLFDEMGAPAPNIEKLASEGLIFDHAFSCSPVCSVARTTLITSIYGPRAGTQFHRKLKMAQLPDGWQMFPAYLRDAGYYTTNNSKKDYNAVEGKGVWDESSRKATWQNRPTKDTPFFHMESHGQSHESSLHFSEKEMRSNKTATDPKKVQLAPYHPDTELFRYTYARYHDRMGTIDGIVGDVVNRLKEEGVLEDTFIFYFGDHGGVLPRSKGYIYESGLHVPMVVRIPKNWKQLVDAKRGDHVEGFVSFVDFGPTVLKLAGVDVPKFTDGKPFLGKGVSMAEVNKRDETFGYADRFDEKYEMCRSLRKGRYKYIRNYQPFYPDGLQNNYRYKMLAYEEWRSLYKEAKLNAAQRQFFESKAPEALYDVESDPHEVSNLAGDPKHAKVLADMRKRLADRVKSLPDLSFYPESFLVERVLTHPIEFGKAHADEIAELVDIADLCLKPFDDADSGIASALLSRNPWIRCWGLTACSVFGKEAEVTFADRARSLLRDDNLMVRVRAAEFLGILGDKSAGPALYEVLKQSESDVVTLLALNTMVFLQDGDPGFKFKVSPKDVRNTKGQVSRRLEYLAK